MKTSSDLRREPSRLVSSAPHLEHALSVGGAPPRKFHVSQVRCETIMVPMRDGIRLATDVYLPPVAKGPAVVIRTPYDRERDDRGYVGAHFSLACRGYVVVSQDVRGTGDSEPDALDVFMFESEDGYDCVEWIAEQPWFDGFIGSFGGSYIGQTQWPMATHAKMGATIPIVSGLGLATSTARLHMPLNVLALATGKGEGKIKISFADLEAQLVEETLATGFFNEPITMSLSPGLKKLFSSLQDLPLNEAQRRIWTHYCSLDSASRAKFVREAFDVPQVTMTELGALTQLLGQHIAVDRHTIPDPSPAALLQSITAPALLKTAWYDWFLNDALETFRQLRARGRPDVAARTRLLIAPYSHNTVGYKEGLGTNRELTFLANPLESVSLFIHWYEAIRNDTVSDWPPVIYYLMGANVWCTAEEWPPQEARERHLYISAEGALSERAPDARTPPSVFRYDPMDPAPTLGGSIVSDVISPGSVDVSAAQARADVLVFTSPVLAKDVDVVGSLKMVLHASTSVVDTDFVVRLTDVFPDGRAIQLQNGILRARHRDLPRAASMLEPGDLPPAASLLEPGAVYALEVDMWATANRFKAGHRIRVDISSADFPHYDRNTNTGGLSEMPIVATQTIFHDPDRPSHLVLSIIGEGPEWKAAQ